MYQPTETVAAKAAKVQSEIESGVTQTEALKNHSMAAETYKKVMRFNKKSRPGHGRKKRMIEIPMMASPTKVAVVVCSPDQLKTVIEQLQ